MRLTRPPTTPPWSTKSSKNCSSGAPDSTHPYRAQTHPQEVLHQENQLMRMWCIDYTNSRARSIRSLISSGWPKSKAWASVVKTSLCLTPWFRRNPSCPLKRSNTWEHPNRCRQPAQAWPDMSTVTVSRILLHPRSNNIYQKPLNLSTTRISSRLCRT